MLTTILILAGIFTYILIGAFIDYLLDEGNLGLILLWPIVGPIMAAIHVGYCIGNWFENMWDDFKESRKERRNDKR